MKKLIIVLQLLYLSINYSYAQSSIDSLFRIEGNTNLNINLQNYAGNIATGPNYGCLNILNKPVWTYWTICDTSLSGSYFPLTVTISDWTQSGINNDQCGMIIWGPFDELTNPTLQLNSANILYCMDFNFATFNPSNFNVFPFQLKFTKEKKAYVMMLTFSDSITDLHIYSLAPYPFLIDANVCGFCNGKVNHLEQNICIVTRDSATNKNMVIWQNDDTTHLSGYIIQRELFVQGQYDSIGFVAKDQPSYFIDQTSNPVQKSYKYRVTGTDECGSINTTQFNFNTHKTIHVVASPGLSGEINLVWNQYEGLGTIPTYYIYRGSNATNLIVYDSISGANISYSDFTPLPGSNFYEVRIRLQSPCTPDGINYYSESRSNAGSALTIGMENNIQSSNYQLSYLPSSHHYNLKIMDSQSYNKISLFDISGNLIENFIPQKEITINTNAYSKGIYFLKMTGNNNAMIKIIML